MCSMRLKINIILLTLISILVITGAYSIGCKMKGQENTLPEKINQNSYEEQKAPLSILEEGMVDGIIFRLGTEKKDVISKLGEPDNIGKTDGSEVFRYKDTYYYFDINRNLLIGIKILQLGKEVYGVKVGMKPEEIKQVLGKPTNEYYNVHDEKWELLYKRDKNELYFVSKDKNSSTNYVLVLKKD